MSLASHYFGCFGHYLLCTKVEKEEQNTILKRQIQTRMPP